MNIVRGHDPGTRSAAMQNPGKHSRNVRHCSARRAADAEPAMRIDSGTFDRVLISGQRDEVMFLGVAFAAPPTGERRWLQR